MLDYDSRYEEGYDSIEEIVWEYYTRRASALNKELAEATPNRDLRHVVEELAQVMTAVDVLEEGNCIPRLVEMQEWLNTTYGYKYDVLADIERLAEVDPNEDVQLVYYQKKVQAVAENFTYGAYTTPDEIAAAGKRLAEYQAAVAVLEELNDPERILGMERWLCDCTDWRS